MDNLTMHKMYQKVKKTNEDRYALGSKKRLLNSIEKKFKTAMIGALARCEERFGFLWGQDYDGELNIEQQRYENIWAALRTDILNHCNGQMRAVLDEVMQYDIKWQQYKTDFIIKEKD